MRRTGNTILVTGGSSGIGLALSRSFLALGNTVIIASRDRQQLEAAVAATPGLHAIPFDQSDPSDIRRFAMQLLDEHPDLDCLVNNAGIQRREDMSKGETADAELQISTNLLGPIRVTAALLPAFLRRPSATIINVSSALGFVPQAVTPTYCATKAAIHAYTEALRFQLRETEIQVIEIVPPMVRTGLQGSHGYNDRAIPLETFVADVIELLGSEPDADEIVVRQARAFRNADRDGTFEFLFSGMNEARAREAGA